MNVFYSKDSLHKFLDYGIDIPLLSERVLKTASALGIVSCKFENISREDIALAHSDSFINKLTDNPESLVLETYELINQNGSYNRYDPVKAKLPLTDFINKALSNVAGTYFCAKKSLEEGFCYHLGGGMHHAMSSKPSGFCMFNDLVITARKLQRQGLVKRVGIIDLDCHKGDGTAEITKNDETISTYSIHMKNGWPLDGDPNSESFIPSTLDVPVDISDDYFSLLKPSLEEFLKKDFDLCLVVHGVDVWEYDTLESSLGIKLKSCEILKRDLFVYNILKEKSIAQSWCLGGGYGDKVSELYIQFLRNLV